MFPPLEATPNKKDEPPISGSPSFVVVIRYFLPARIRNLQIVRYRKYAWNGIGLNVGHVLVCLIIYNTGQGYMPVVHDDVDRWLGSQTIALQRRKSINRSGFPPAN